jgi:hypothetical protein
MRAADSSAVYHKPHPLSQLAAVVLNVDARQHDLLLFVDLPMQKKQVTT